VCIFVRLEMSSFMIHTLNEFGNYGKHDFDEYNYYEYEYDEDLKYYLKKNFS
jgi:hypothetical protein